MVLDSIRWLPVTLIAAMAPPAGIADWGSVAARAWALGFGAASMAGNRQTDARSTERGFSNRNLPQPRTPGFRDFPSPGRLARASPRGKVPTPYEAALT